ncbi:MAG: hypothetical protein LBR77_00645 [Lachnospiraceae bacterium]|nr:hypothetical protein [Lachnospiraceae bacterium]
MRKVMNRIKRIAGFAAGLVAGLLSFAVVVTTVGTIRSSAFLPPETNSVGPITDVWLDVIKENQFARISVMVPVAYGFAVNGSLNTTDTVTISVSNSTLITSNIRITVDDHSSPNSSYTISVGADSNIAVYNYSTDVPPSEQANADPNRVGLALNMGAKMIRPVDPLSSLSLSGIDVGWWQFTELAPTPTAADFKKFRLSIDGHAFDQLISGTSGTPDVVGMNGTLALPAPPNLALNGWTADGIAIVPSITTFPVGVEVGGLNGQYHQVEESMKVGQIVWNVTPVP